LPKNINDTHPLRGYKAIALGSSKSSVMRDFLLDPSKDDTSITSRPVKTEH